MNTKKPNRKTVRAAIRGSVPDGKLKQAKIVLSDARQNQGQIGGFTEYDRKRGGLVTKLGAPSTDTAFGIAVRGHETRHASRHTPPRKVPETENAKIAGQIVDDVNVETMPLPAVRGIREYQRAHLATAVNDLRVIMRNVRAVKQGKMPDTIAGRNGNILCGMRVLAMIKHYGDEESLNMVRYRAFTKLRQAIGDKMVSAITQVIRHAKIRRNRAKAISMLCALLETPEDQDLIEVEGSGEGEPTVIAVEGDALDGEMKVIDLRPKSVYCAKQKQVSMRHSPSGVIINAVRFVNAVVSGDSNGLFSRRVREKAGGTVVIDASGSMGASAKNLAALCALIPTATVAFYCGNDRAKGILVVYADKGKRFAGEIPDQYVMGGNCVDLPAVKWLLKHGKPWTFVSDLAFCGGVIGSEVIAKALIERAVSRGELTHYASLDAAFEAFGGKGKLPD